MNTNNKTYYYEEEGLMTMPSFDMILAENGYHCEYYGKWHAVTSHTEVYKNPKLESENGRSVFAHGGQNHVYMDYINKHVPVRPLKPGELYDTFTKRPYETDPYYNMYPAEEMVPPVSINDDMENSPYRTTNGRLGLTEYTDPELIKYMISNYYGMVKEIDDWVGIMLEKLDELGLTDNTLVIFVSDHGEMLGAHGMREKNVFYEESSHIPLIVRLPGEIKPETTVEGYVSLVDLFPTILDYLGIEEHKSDGKSLRGLIDGTDKEHGEYVVAEWNYRGDVVSNYMVLKDGWKLLVPYSAESDVINAMYDLNTDPHEMNNLLGNNPDRANYEEKAEELRSALLEWLQKNNSKYYEGVSQRKLL